MAFSGSFDRQVLYAGADELVTLNCSIANRWNPQLLALMRIRGAKLDR